MKRINFSKEIKKEVWDKTNGRCWYCGVRLTPFNFQIDHRWPISKEGNNSLENLVPCCQKCNYEKGGKDFLEWCVYVSNKYGTTLSAGQWAMLRSEGFSPEDNNEFAWEVPVIFYGCRNYPWFNESSVHIKYKGWHE